MLRWLPGQLPRWWAWLRPGRNQELQRQREAEGKIPLPLPLLPGQRPKAQAMLLAKGLP